MTIRGYIESKLGPYGGLPEALLVDMDAALEKEGVSLAYEYDAATMEATVAKTMIASVAEFLFMPKASEVGDTGSKIVYDYEGLAKWYLWMCHKWGVPVDEEVLAELGLGSIIDRTEIW